MPPASPASTTNKGVLIALGAVGGLVGVVLMLIGAVTFLGHTTTTAAPAGTVASSPSTSPPPSTPTAGADATPFAQRYLAAVATSNADTAVFFQKVQVAESTPCGCPAGEFDLSSVVPYLPTLDAA